MGLLVEGWLRGCVERKEKGYGSGGKSGGC